jgi:hypothetical protein
MKADSTLRTSWAVPHPSTNRALCRLTSEVERDPVHSTRYGRQRKHPQRPVSPKAAKTPKNLVLSSPLRHARGAASNSPRCDLRRKTSFLLGRPAVLAALLARPPRIGAGGFPMV